MDFEEIMATFVGRSVEIFQPGQFLAGVLQGADASTLVVSVSPSAYTPVAGDVRVSDLRVSFVRVLP